MMGYQPIERYGVIGDLYTTALVGMDGSIDFMSFPDFDSPTIFARMLDRTRGGSFRLAPLLEDANHRQLYLPDTNVLLTRFLSADGVGEISDFMPVYGPGHIHDIVRRAKTVRGELRFRMCCDPRFEYGRAAHRVEQNGDEVLFIPDGHGDTALRLRTSVPVRIDGGAAVAEFTLGAGASASFVLEEARAGVQSPTVRPDYVTTSFKETVNFWRRWVGRSTYQGRWREQVNRSALVLKLLTSRKHGSIVAAPTFGLPEAIGGERNWDYRYTWIRDASFTIYGLIRLGYTEEAGEFMTWIQDRCAELEPDGALRVLYRIDGGHETPEETLEHFEGYRGSRPVRIGNGAADQLQLDIAGELMDAVYLYDKYGSPIGYDFWCNLMRMIEWVCANWRRPDMGIWEVRGGAHEFLLSKVMCWVAVDRAIRLARKRSFPAPIAQWVAVRDDIYRDIFDRFWDPTLETFVQFAGSKTVDAACLLMPLMLFVSPRDPRWLSTLRAVERTLVHDSLVYRYLPDQAAPDGLSGSEGTFCMCSFWYAECVSRGGDPVQARFLFEKMLGYANHLGLYAEELGPRGEHLGNFPQAFTHLALISAAYEIDRSLNKRNHSA
jgi:GH15 family glucan-1,4-alpha-glucosidase